MQQQHPKMHLINIPSLCSDTSIDNDSVVDKSFNDQPFMWMWIVYWCVILYFEFQPNYTKSLISTRAHTQFSQPYLFVGLNYYYYLYASRLAIPDRRSKTLTINSQSYLTTIKTANKLNRQRVNEVNAEEQRATKNLRITERSINAYTYDWKTNSLHRGFLKVCIQVRGIETEWNRKLMWFSSVHFYPH